MAGLALMVTLKGGLVNVLPPKPSPKIEPSKLSKAVVYPISPRNKFYIAAGFLEHYPKYPKDRLGRVQYHTGADYNLSTGGDSDLGQPVFAVADGVVTYAGFVPGVGWGNLVQLEHMQFGVWTRYAHLLKILVKPGQQVKAGQLIGKLGKSGFQPYAHLHFDVSVVNPGARAWFVTDPSAVKKTYVDPDQWLKNRNAVSLGDL